MGCGMSDGQVQVDQRKRNQSEPSQMAHGPWACNGKSQSPQSQSPVYLYILVLVLVLILILVTIIPASQKTNPLWKMHRGQ